MGPQVDIFCANLHVGARFCWRPKRKILLLEPRFLGLTFELLMGHLWFLEMKWLYRSGQDAVT